MSFFIEILPEGVTTTLHNFKELSFRDSTIQLGRGRRFKVDNSSRQYHGALKDAELLAEVYVELTGGRQTSFVIKNESIGFNSDKDLSVDTLGNKIVIRPTQEEQIFHKEFLQKIFN